MYSNVKILQETQLFHNTSAGILLANQSLVIQVGEHVHSWALDKVRTCINAWPGPWLVVYSRAANQEPGQVIATTHKFPLQAFSDTVILSDGKEMIHRKFEIDE